MKKRSDTNTKKQGKVLHIAKKIIRVVDFWDHLLTYWYYGKWPRKKAPKAPSSGRRKR